MDCKVNPGRSVQTDKLYLPGETLELKEGEAKKLQKRGIVSIVTKTTSAASGSGSSDRPNAKDSIKLTEDAETLAALDALAVDEERTTVIAAIDKRREELTPAE